MLDGQTATEIKAHFERWSGGFPPDSDDQITVYIDYAREDDADAEDVRDILKTWMREAE